jgi:hypothetical protein
VAPYTYYYLISIALTLSSVLYIMILIYARITGQLLWGPKLKLGSPEQARLRSFAHKRGNLPIAAGLVILSIANLLRSIVLTYHLHTSAARNVLIFGPIPVAVISVVIILRTRNIYNEFNIKQRKD